MKNILSLLIILLILSISCSKDDSSPQKINIDWNFSALCLTSDGGILTTGSRSETGIVISKFDENCNLEWNETGYSWGTVSTPTSHPPAELKVVKAIEVEENNFVLICRLSDDFFGVYSYFLVKIDSYGKQLWEKGIYQGAWPIHSVKTENGFAGMEEYRPHELINIDEEGILVNTSNLTEIEKQNVEKFAYNSESDNVIIITKTDTVSAFKRYEYSLSGDLINKIEYNINFDSMNLNYNKHNSFILTDNKGIIFTGRTNDSENLIMRINESSEISWIKNLDRNSNIYLQSISDNEFLCKSSSNILYLDYEGELLGSKDITEDEKLFFQNNEFVFQLFLDDDKSYWVTKIPFNEFFSD